MSDYEQRYRTLDIRFRCGGCVRCAENHKRPGHFRCCSVHGPEEITPDRIACLEYWDKKKQEKSDAEFEASEERKRQRQWKQNSRKAPVPCAWEDDFDGTTDTLHKDAIPICPNCREFLYVTERCYFCGQAILMDEKLAALLAPPEVERMDCFVCGGEETVEFTRAKSNGHKSGHCTKCGMRFIE